MAKQLLQWIGKAKGKYVMTVRLMAATAAPPPPPRNYITLAAAPNTSTIDDGGDSDHHGYTSNLNNKPYSYMVAKFNTRLMTTTAAKATTIDDDGDDDEHQSPCLDLFFNAVKPHVIKGSGKMVANVEEEYLKRVLPLAWSHNPLTTLKLIWNLLYLGADSLQVGAKSYLQDAAESYLQAFYTAAHWLHHNHPKTLALSSAIFTLNSFGGFRIAAEMLRSLLLEIQQQEHRDGELTRKQKVEDYHLLHDRISDLFVEHLKSCIQCMKSVAKSYPDYDSDGFSYLCTISEAALTYINSSTHRQPPTTTTTTTLFESLARELFPPTEYQAEEKEEEADYADMVRKRLFNEILLPLYDAQFCYAPPRSEPKQEKEEDIRRSVVDKYMAEVKAGKTQIAADAMLPHEIMLRVPHWNVGKVAELQWMSMVEDFKIKGKMNNCLAACHRFNGIYRSRESAFANAVGLLVSELSEEPWKGKRIQYPVSPSSPPELHLIQGGDDLRYKWDYLTRRSNRDCVECLEEVFDLILEVAVNGNLKPEQMIRKVIVFPDRYHFHHNFPDPWNAAYKAIHSKFKDKGYGDVVPHLVCWYLTYPPQTNGELRITLPGATILSAFYTDDFFKLFLDNDGDIGPEHIMEDAISDKDYQSLVVVD